MNNPLISVIIVNYNGYQWLERCLDSLKRQSYKNYEIVFVDNASSDESISYVRENYPNVKIVKNKTNTGFAGGNNYGYKKSKGEFIVLLNNDTYVERDYLKNLLVAFKNNSKLAVAQSKIVLMNKNELDTCGGFWTATSFLYYYGNYKDPSLPIYNKPFKVFTVKAASVMIKREVIEKIGLFDEDFWNYYEEGDFCHRVWIAGYECWYWPKAVCSHAMGGTSLVHFDNSFVQYHNFKNKLMSFIKNFELFNLIFIVPIFVLSNVGISVVWLFKGQYRYSIQLFRALFWNLRNLSKNIGKRSAIAKFKVKKDSEIFKVVRKNPGIRYYYYLLNKELSKYED